MILGFERDWSNSCVSRIWACYTQCDTIEDFFHGQTLIKFIFKSKLWQYVSLVPHFSPRLPKFLEISKFGSFLDHVIKCTRYLAWLESNWNFDSLKFYKLQAIKECFLDTITPYYFIILYTLINVSNHSIWSNLTFNTCSGGAVEPELSFIHHWRDL